MLRADHAGYASGVVQGRQRVQGGDRVQDIGIDANGLVKTIPAVHHSMPYRVKGFAFHMFEHPFSGLGMVADCTLLPNFKAPDSEALEVRLSANSLDGTGKPGL